MSNKKIIDESSIKIKEIEKILSIETPQNNNNNQIPENVPSDINQINNMKDSGKSLINRNKKNALTYINKDKASIDLDLIKEKALELNNKDLEKKIKDLHKKINELDKICKKFATIDNYYELKNEMSDIKLSLNKFVTNNDIKAIYNKTEENEKEIKLLKSQYEGIENNLDIKDELKSLKKFVETFSNRMQNLENSEKNLKNKIESEINEKTNINQKLNLFLETKTFDNYKNQLTKEFSNINVNFVHTRKLLDEIIENMKEKVMYNDLKIFEKALDAKLEAMQLSSYKKYAEKLDTLKSFKYLEQQIRNLYEIIHKKSGESEQWLIAKKPINSNLCASCESYIGDLKDNNPYIPWNKYPLRDPNDKLYRLGNGYSKMLQMINIEDDKKNSTGINLNIKDDLNNFIKKTENLEKAERSQLSVDFTPSNFNFNKTTGNFFKSPQKNFPLIKKKILIKNRSDIESIEENEKKSIEMKSQRNKINEMINYKSTENFGTNTENNIQPDEQIIVSTSPKITKIIKKK